MKLRTLVWIALLLIAADSASATVLVGHWRLDENGGTVAGDSSGNNLHGTLIGPVTWTAGQLGAGLLFDPTVFTAGTPGFEYVNIPHNPVLNFGDIFTLSFWINGAAVQNGAGGIATIIDKSHGGANGNTGWAVQARTAEPGSISFALGTAAGFPEPRIPGVLDGTWHHVSIVVAVTPKLTIRGFVDGSLAVHFVDNATTPGFNNGPLLFGTWWGGGGGPSRPFFGKLDDVRLYSGALNPCEIAALANPAGTPDCNSNGLPDTCDAAPSDGVGPNEHRVFVTSLTHDGNFNGIAGADGLCQQIAQNVGLRREYKAIMSDTNNPANARIVLNGGGILLFNAAQQPIQVKANGNLWDGAPLLHPLDHDEFANLRSIGVWTGSLVNGDSLTTSNGNCLNWSEASGIFSAGFGRSDTGTTSWISASIGACNLPRGVYCISQSVGSEPDCNSNGVPDTCDGDSDSDGVIDGCDNCPNDFNPGQEESDGDGVPDACDNCPAIANANQADADGDDIGNPCDPDDDGDNVDDTIDACPGASPCVLSDATGRPRSDLNGDCRIDGRDVQLLVNCILAGGGACAGVDPDGDGVMANLDVGDDRLAFVSHALAPAFAPCP